MRPSACRPDDAELREVTGSHIGLGVNHQVYRVLAEVPRLRRDHPFADRATRGTVIPWLPGPPPTSPTRPDGRSSSPAPTRGIGLVAARELARGRPRRAGRAATSTRGPRRPPRSTRPAPGQHRGPRARSRRPLLGARVRHRAGGAPSTCSSTTRASWRSPSGAPPTASRCRSAPTSSVTSRSPACCSTHVADRVVTLSSRAHRMGSINIEDLNWRRRRYPRWPAYGQSKLADLMFAYELEHRFVAAGSPLRSVAAHPGYSGHQLQIAHRVDPGRRSWAWPTRSSPRDRRDGRAAHPVRRDRARPARRFLHRPERVRARPPATRCRSGSTPASHDREVQRRSGTRPWS